MPRKLIPKIQGYPDETAAILIGVTRRTLLRYLQNGTVQPPRAMMGKNRRAWQEDDIAAARRMLREKSRAR